MFLSFTSFHVFDSLKKVSGFETKLSLEKISSPVGWP
jgi:hypothetical protein